MMRKPNKASLIQSLLGKDYQAVDQDGIISTKYYVVDGGVLLRKVIWKQGSTFQEVVNDYRRYVRSNYGKPTISFDGYGNNPSTKDHEHFRRSLKSSGCPDVKVPLNQHTFLSNDSDKSELISLISDKLEEDGCSIKHSPDDADTLIVETALNLSKDGESVTVFANDTDIVIMLMHFWENQLGTIVVRSEYKKSGGKQLKQLNVQSAVSTVNDTIVPYLLVIHAFG